MSLRDGTDTCILYPEIQTVDTFGNTITMPSAVGVQINNCSITPLRNKRDDDHIEEIYRFAARTVPDGLGNWSEIEWNNRRFFIREGPFWHSSSPTTSHVAAHLQEIR